MHQLSPSALVVSVNKREALGMCFAFWGHVGRETFSVYIHKATVVVRRQRTQGTDGRKKPKKYGRIHLQNRIETKRELRINQKETIVKIHLCKNRFRFILFLYFSLRKES